MKMVSLAVEGLTITRLLREASKSDAVFLSVGGEIRYALMPADEGDQEVCALRSNSEFMAYLAECKERAVKGPRISLQEMRERHASPQPPQSRRRKSRATKTKAPA